MKVYQVQNQPNFGKVYMGPELKHAIHDGKIPSKKLNMIKEFEKKYQESKITTILGLADFGKRFDRLDAQVFYRESDKIDTKSKSFKYIAENLLGYYMKISPKIFLNRIGRKIKSLEKTYVLQ